MTQLRAGPHILRVVRTGIVPVVQSTPTEDNVVSWGDDTAVLEDAGFAKSNVFLVDGSRAFTSYVDFSEIAEPASPAANSMRLFAVDDSGVTTLETKDADGHVFRVHEDTYRVARNTTGSQISKGDVVYFSGSTGNKPNIALARANSESTMPAIGLAYDDIADNAFGIVLVIGHFGGIDTSAFNEGDVLYVSSTTAGALTTTRPAHPNFAQFLGTVETSSVGAGQILLSVAPAFLGRSSGTNQNNFTIGDQTAGAKTLTFDNGNLGVVSWNPTAARTVTIPDETMTLAGRNVANVFTENQTLSGASLIVATDLRGMFSDTSDGADNKGIRISGGGAYGQGRGASIQLIGNERSSAAGQLFLLAGNVSGGHIFFFTGGLESARIANNGHLLLNTTTDAAQLTVQGDGSDILSLKDSGGTAQYTMDSSGVSTFDSRIVVVGDTFSQATDNIAEFKEGGGTQKYLFPSSGNFLMSLGVSDDSVQFVGASETGGTESGYIQVEINGVTRYIRVFSTS